MEVHQHIVNVGSCLSVLVWRLQTLSGLEREKMTNKTDD